MGGQRPELERQLPAECERAFGTYQQVREVRLAIGAKGQRTLAIEQIDVVARHSPQYLRHLLADFIALSLGDASHALDEQALCAHRTTLRSVSRTWPGDHRPERRRSTRRCGP